MDQPQILTPEELMLIRQYILLPLLIKVIDTNIDNLKYSDYSMKNVYMASSLAMLDMVNHDFLEARKQLLKAKIKVVEIEPTANYELNYAIHFRGYTEEFRLMKSLAKSQLSIAMGNYTEEIERLMRKK